MDEPTHDRPPFDGAGFEQERLRYRRPPAHVDEHADQLFHADQLPSIGQLADPLQIAVSIASPAHSCPLRSTSDLTPTGARR